MFSLYAHTVGDVVFGILEFCGGASIGDQHVCSHRRGFARDPLKQFALHKVLTKLPVGFFLAWIEAGRDLTGSEDEKLKRHRAMRTEFLDGQACDYARRARQRDIGSRNPALAQLFTWELLYGDGWSHAVVEPLVQS